MTRSKTTILIGKGFIILCMFSLSYVALLSFFSPQATMDLVNTHLPNNDAISSIRGVYGGVGLSIVLLLAYLWKYDTPKALLFLGIFWGFYALSRIITQMVDGPLGDFGTQWLIIESIFTILAFLLYYLIPKERTQS